MLAAAAGLCLAASQSRADLLVLDEYGFGSYNGAPLSGQMLPDPSGGIVGPPVMVYALPAGVVFQPGDVVMFDPDGDFGQSWENYQNVSDVVRFWGNQAIFYSDKNTEGVGGEPADTGFPTFIISPNIGVLEQGVEGGMEWADYTALLHGGLPSDPGYYIPVAGSASFQFISDVPEPSVILTNGVILLAVGLGAWYFRRRAAMAA
jgi:hypothetical protein